MGLRIPFDNSYARLSEAFFARQSPTPVEAPRLIAFNDDLARILGITPGMPEDHAATFGGNRLPDGAEPLAQLYAGHQFGGFNPQLGDGRAVLLGETVGIDGLRRDIQLKGSGPTPFSRMGDGRAWVGPVLREYLVSETMHALGVPTTRALAAVETGELVYREGPLPGAVLTRVARSHLRVGTFQVFAARDQIDELSVLTRYAIDRHYPTADGPLGLLAAVAEAQAELVARWLAVGFIHGVMNTDNCSIAGETIDYGPCAFMDRYDPRQVYSSIDDFGRYAYGNQPEIAVWNVAQLATALVHQCEDRYAAIEEATRIVRDMRDRSQAHRRRLFRAKIGLATDEPEDVALINDLLQLMAEHDADFTNTFRALSEGGARDEFTDPAAFDAWESRWRVRVAREGDPVSTMRQANPAFIPRNHQVEALIEAAVAGDHGPFKRALKVLSRPYEAQPDAEDLARPPRPEEVVRATFCGT